MKKIYSTSKYLILGADGFLGSRLFDRLKNMGLDVYGTSRMKKFGKGILFLDTLTSESVDNFPWNRFDVIIDCIGNIDYQNTIESIENNFRINTIGPLTIIKNLSKKQKYFYCSTHAVLLSQERQNSYSLSKLFFEKSLEIVSNIKGKVTIMRIPAIFTNERKSGLLHEIKKNSKKRKTMEIAYVSCKWHAMYLPRIIDVILSIILAKRTIGVINIGYSTGCKIDTIVDIAENVFGGKYIKFKIKKEDYYIPDIENQKKFYKIDAVAFKEDIYKYFNS